MKAAYNQNDIGLYPLEGIYENSCKHCMFFPTDNSACILADFDEGDVDELPRCWNAIFIPEPLSDIFLCKSNI